jgi:hypothetical protein
MPSLDNPRYELFAQTLARGVSQSDAYVEAGFQSTTPDGIANNAARLAAKPEVKQRVDELLARAAKHAELRAADILSALLEDRSLARERGQVAAAIRALELYGKQIGMFVDKREIKTGVLDDLNPEQLDTITEAAIAIAARRIAQGRGAGETASENQDVLPGSGAAAAGTVPEAS